MRLLVDATAADFGGIRTYVDQLLHAWAAVFPQDDLVVALPSGSDLDVHGHERVDVDWRGPAMLARPVAQSRLLPRVARDHRVDAVLATNPTTSLRRFEAPLVVVVHDLRHERRPDQFSPVRRGLRWAAYRRSYGLADGFVAVSERTLGDLHALHPSTSVVPSAVVHHGADHVLEWPTPSRVGPALAFGHHTNKNPDLVVDAWALLHQRGAAPQLVIVGLDETSRARIGAKVGSSGLEEYVTLAPYLDERAFRDNFARAAAVVFPSEFEGFGLPILEAMLLGKPVVICPDDGALEVAGGQAVVAGGWTAAEVADAVRHALTAEAGALAAARAHAATHTWARAAEETRALVSRVLTHPS